MANSGEEAAGELCRRERVALELTIVVLQSAKNSSACGIDVVGCGDVKP
jgi:hypothetical protein